MFKLGCHNDLLLHKFRAYAFCWNFEFDPLIVNASWIGWLSGAFVMHDTKEKSCCGFKHISFTVFSCLEFVVIFSNFSFLSYQCLLYCGLQGGDPSQERNHALEVTTSSLSTLARFPWGSRSLPESLDSQDITISDPPMRMQLFEFEACPFCRRVREALTELDLSVEVYPCPKGSLRHREMVRSFGGKELFPFLIDPNSGISMYESGDIVKYLFKQYGKGRSPSLGLLESTLFTGWMPTILRAGRGMMLWEKARQDPPPRKLELFSYENNPVRYHVPDTIYLAVVLLMDLNNALRVYSGMGICFVCKEC
ncbi:hypothetical protein REPUB_Repub16aG0032400 [Reevesia pubescens]